MEQRIGICVVMKNVGTVGCLNLQRRNTPRFQSGTTRINGKCDRSPHDVYFYRRRDAMKIKLIFAVFFLDLHLKLLNST